MKFKEIKNKKLNELTMGEISFFLNHLEGLQTKYGVPADFITVELFSDFSKLLCTVWHDEQPTSAPAWAENDQPSYCRSLWQFRQSSRSPN